LGVGLVRLAVVPLALGVVLGKPLANRRKLGLVDQRIALRDSADSRAALRSVMSTPAVIAFARRARRIPAKRWISSSGPLASLRLRRVGARTNFRSA